MKTLNRLDITGIRKNVCDQGYALARSERAIDQALPHWNAIAKVPRGWSGRRA